MHIHDMRISFDNSGDPLLDDKALEIFPDSLSIESEEGKVFSARCNGRRAVTYKDVALELCICRDEEDHVALEIRLKAVKSRIRRVRLVWERPGRGCRRIALRSPWGCVHTCSGRLWRVSPCVRQG